MQWQDIYPNKASLAPQQLKNDYLDTFSIEPDKIQQTMQNVFTEDQYVQFSSAYSHFQDVKAYPSFTKLDRILPYPHLLPESINLIHTNDKAGSVFIIQEFFIQMILKYYTQGVVFIDCTNVFPAYELIESAVDVDPLLDPQLPIRSVQLSRAFNYHQVTEVLTEHLEPLVRDGFSITLDDLNEDKPINVKPKFVIIAGLADLYLNQESAQYLGYDGRQEWFSIFELQHALGHLKMLAMKYNLIPIITTSTAPRSKLKPLGGSFLTHSASQILKISSEGNGLYGELIKHPFAGPRKMLLHLLRAKYKKITSKRLYSYLN